MNVPNEEETHLTGSAMAEIQLSNLSTLGQFRRGRQFRFDHPR